LQSNRYHEHRSEDPHRHRQDRRVNGSRQPYTEDAVSSPRRIQHPRQNTANSVASPFFKKATISRPDEGPQVPAFRFTAPGNQNQQSRLVSRQGPVEYRGQKTTNGLSFIQEPETAMSNRSMYSAYTGAEPTRASMRPMQDGLEPLYRQDHGVFHPPPQTPRRSDLGTVQSLPSMQPSIQGPYMTPSRPRHGTEQLITVRGAKVGACGPRDVLSAHPAPMGNIWSSGGGVRVRR